MRFRGIRVFPSSSWENSSICRAPWSTSTSNNCREAAWWSSCRSTARVTATRSPTADSSPGGRCSPTIPSETVRLYTTIKDFVLEKLSGLREEGKRRLGLFGASETCEVVLSALRDTEFQVMLLLDNDTRKQGQIFNGHVVSAPHVLDQVDCDAVVITSFGKQTEIYGQLKPYSEKRGFQIVRF